MAEKTRKTPSWLVAGDGADNNEEAGGQNGLLKEHATPTAATATRPDESSQDQKTDEIPTTGDARPPVKESEHRVTPDEGFIRKVLSKPGSFLDVRGADAQKGAVSESLAKGVSARLATVLPDARARIVAIMGLFMLIGILIVWHALALWPFGVPDSRPAEVPASPNKALAAPSSPASTGVVDTGVTFGDLNTKDGKASLSGAGLEWSGDVTSGAAGETITLKGPTAVQIRRGFEMPRSSIQSGVFAVAQQNGDVLHVVFNTFEAGDTEITQGSIFAVHDNNLVFSGYYRDERKPGSDTVVRTYMPPGGQNYRRSFKAPEGTPIPLLVGFKGVATKKVLSGSGS